MSGPPRAADLRAALWAARALRQARRRLAEGQTRQIRLHPPPTLPASAVRGVEAILRRRRHTCLEGALVRQRWLAAHGVKCDVVIGVTAPSAGFSAHAWLDRGDAPAPARPHVEIARLAATD
jgi:transglutaminase superfamily protein